MGERTGPISLTAARRPTGRVDPETDPRGEEPRTPFWTSVTSRVSGLFSGASSRTSSGGGDRGGVLRRFWHPRYGPIVLWTLAAFAIVWGVIYLGTNVVRTAFEGERPAPYAETVQEAPAATERSFAADETDVVAPVVEADRQAPAAPQERRRPAAADADDVRSDWILPLSRRQISRYYPRRALEKGIEGRATLRCTFGDERYPDCTVISERPDEWRFGSSARRLSRRFRATSRAVKGESFSVTIRFRLER